MLRGLKVLQFEGLAPSVFLGMYFADQGAQVVLIARPQPAPFSMDINKNILNKNKLCIKLSLKEKIDREILVQMIKKSDVIIDPYRPGVLQKESFGPEDLQKINPKIVLLRVTGYGQQGRMALKPGHDLNYIGSSGVLTLINQKDSSKLQYPANYLADFVSASLGINGTLKAIEIVKKTGQGCVVDCSLAEGCSYLTKLIRDSVQIEKKRQNKQEISYFEIGQKRYVITFNNSVDFSQSFKKQIEKIIKQINSNNQQYFKNDKLQIAQIKKIRGIKKSNLKNPFNPLQSEQLSYIIPYRDQHRKEILASFRIIPSAKL